uniref:Uncharacterized protein n=1 Tax=Pygocentrus nattereri TaxID=42514 RepID=A0AAR2KZG5_PYGNA
MSFFKTSQSAGSGQSHQRPVNHSRPFFYVQPPVQPFYTYQWHMNSPYSHNIPGAGFHFGRPCMMPYSYLQYPGYVVPHTAVHPVDYRRIYERSIPPGASAAAYDFSFRQQQHTGTQRETTCAGAQTDPCEALNKLIECLDQLRAGEELHSSVNSQTSGTLSPLAEEKSEEETGACVGKMFSSSNTAEPDTKACCSGWDGPKTHWPSSQSSPIHPSSTRTIESQATERAQNHPAGISGDYSCCVLHLPFEKVVNAGVYGPGCTPRSLGSPFSYCPTPLSHERVSVLSPSLDELSSHDELLSTDPEDIGLFPTRIYPRGKLAEVASRKSHPSVGEIHADMCVLYPKRLTCAVCGSKTFKECSRPKSFHCETHCYGDVDDSDEEAIEAKSGDWGTGRTCKHCLRSTTVKIQTAKKTHPLSKHRQKHREKLGELEEKPGHTEAHCTEYVCCEKCMSSPEKSTGHFARVINARPFKGNCDYCAAQILTRKAHVFQLTSYLPCFQHE